MGDLQIDPLNRNVAMFTNGYGLYRTTNLMAAELYWTFFTVTAASASPTS